MSSRVLIIEDNSKIRLSGHLSSRYEVIEIHEPANIIDSVIEFIPDLIIIGISLKNQNGYNICTNLKEHEKSWLIPCILLNNQNQAVDKMKIWKAGADAYMAPPVDIDELLLRVEVLIGMRKKLIRASQLSETDGNDLMNSKDQAFLAQIKDIISQQMGDEDFSALDLARKAGISHPHLHRKLKKLIGQNCSQFIRQQRLEQASRLIKQNTDNIGEISFKLGFSSPSYFTRCFKQAYGCLPSQYLEKANY